MAAAIELARAQLDDDGERAATLLTTVLTLCRGTLEEAAPWVGPVRWELGEAGRAARPVALPRAARESERRRNALRFEEVRVEMSFQGCVLLTAESLAAESLAAGGATSVVRAQLVDACAAGPARYLRLRLRRPQTAAPAVDAEQLSLL